MSYPPGTVVYHCPLPECEWTFAHPPADAFSPAGTVPVITGETLDEAIGRAALAISMQWYAEAEDALEAHLSTHTLLEWVTEIDRLSRLLSRRTPTGPVIEVDRSDLAEVLTCMPHEGTAWERLADRMLSTSRSAPAGPGGRDSNSGLPSRSRPVPWVPAARQHMLAPVTAR